MEASNGKPEEHAETLLIPLIDKVIKHHEHYYETKYEKTKEDVFAVLHPPWRSSLEDAFLWIGGWRPSMAFHLLYSQSGLEIESSLAEFLQGIQAKDLGGLSSVQMSQINDLQAKTIREEREITEELAKHQETVADPAMVEMSHIATEAMRSGEEEISEAEEKRVESTLAPKEEGLVEMLKKADELRLKTLKEVLNILSPIQSAHFLIAAAELNLRIHDWGKRKDYKKAGFGKQNGN